MKTRIIISLIALLTWVNSMAPAAPLGTVFTYQGRLCSGTDAASGNYGLTFTLYDAASDGSIVAGPITNSPVGVTNGLFTTTLDFGSGVFTGNARWLEIGVRTNGAPVDFTTLAPRQPLTAAPYALYAPSAGTVASVPAANINGTLSLAQLPSTVVTNTQSGVNLSGTFAGSGAGLTNLNASALIGTTPVVWLSNTPPGSQTAGIQEAINKLATNSAWQFSGAGGEVYLMPGIYNCSTQIVIPNWRPFHLTLRGSGRNSTLINYIGTTPTNFIVCATNTDRMYIESPTRLAITDLGISASSNKYEMTLLDVGGYLSVHLNRVAFGNYHVLTEVKMWENAVTESSGLLGLYLRPSQNLDCTLQDCLFYGLGAGAHLSCDHVRIYSTVFLDCGAYYVGGTSFTYGSARTRGIQSLGAGVIYDGPFGDFDAHSVFFSTCGIAFVNNSPANYFYPTLVDCFDVNSHFKSATTDISPTVFRNFDDVSLAAANVILTNTTAGIPVPARGIHPLQLHDFDTTRTRLSYGTDTNLTFAVDRHGDLTNAGRFSSLAGALVGNTTRTLTTNFWLFNGFPNSVINGSYVAGAAIGAHLRWTNPTTGAFLVYDDSAYTTQEFNQTDYWEFYDAGSNSLASAGYFDPAYPSTVINFGFSGVTFWASTTTTDTNPTLSFSGTMTAAFAGDGSALTNLSGAHLLEASVVSSKLADAVWTQVRMEAANAAVKAAAGVTQAAIQGLNQKVEARSRRLEEENSALDKEVADLRALVEVLAVKVNGSGQ